MSDIAQILTPEFMAAAAVNMDRRPAPSESACSNIYDDFIEKEHEGVKVKAPQPTLGFLLLYNERKSYFWDNKLGIGRLRWALLHREKVRALRAGWDIPDKEAKKFAVKTENEAALYIAIVHEAAKATVEAEDTGNGTLGPAGAFAQLVEFTGYDIDKIIYGMHYTAFIGLIQGTIDLSRERKEASESDKDGTD